MRQHGLFDDGAVTVPRAANLLWTSHRLRMIRPEMNEPTSLDD